MPPLPGTWENREVRGFVPSPALGAWCSSSPEAVKPNSDGLGSNSPMSCLLLALAPSLMDPAENLYVTDVSGTCPIALPQRVREPTHLNQHLILPRD